MRNGLGAAPVHVSTQVFIDIIMILFISKQGFAVNPINDVSINLCKQILKAL